VTDDGMPHGNPEEDPELASLAVALVRDRPEPGSGLRGHVRAFLEAADVSGLLIARPGRLWLRVAALAIVGVALLALVAAGVAGSGPFAA
jgi:hypothetical protein